MRAKTTGHHGLCRDAGAATAGGCMRMCSSLLAWLGPMQLPDARRMFVSLRELCLRDRSTGKETYERCLTAR